METADRQQQRANLAENQRDRERLEKELEKQRADRQQQRADRAELDLQKMRERLLKLGIDPETLP